MCALFSPEILQAVAVKGLKNLFNHILNGYWLFASQSSGPPSWRTTPQTNRLAITVSIMLFKIPSFRTHTHTKKQCSALFPSQAFWNQQPVSVRHAVSHSSFKSSLKTFPFKNVSFSPIAPRLCVCVGVCVCCLLYTSPSPRDFG